MRLAQGVLVLSICLVPPAAAQTVGLAPAQDPGFPGEVSGKGPMAYIVSACLGSLFDAGLIATDAPCAAVDRETWLAPSFGLAAAGEGFEDYLIAVYADWRPSSFAKAAWLASEVDYRLVRVSDGATLASGSLEGPVDSAEAAAQAGRISGGIGAAIGKACAAALGQRLLGGKR